jgi:hypothetical protein
VLEARYQAVVAREDIKAINMEAKVRGVVAVQYSAVYWVGRCRARWRTCWRACSGLVEWRVSGGSVWVSGGRAGGAVAVQCSAVQCSVLGQVWGEVADLESRRVEQVATAVIVRQVHLHSLL